ncbi:MAG: NB-ARC domain-containing protein [Cyanobacteria bacterium P01_F01_bin.33]
MDVLNSETALENQALQMALEEVDRALAPLGLNDIQSLVFRQVWIGQTYTQMADEAGYDPNYLKDVGYRLWKQLSAIWHEKVTKSNIHSVVRRCWEREEGSSIAHQLPSQASRETSEAEGSSVEQLRLSSTRISWGEAVDTATFLGRDRELDLLRHWIVGDRCRLIALLGMGGMGKTTLSVRVAESVAEEFDCIVWRSLRNAPLLSDLLADVMPLVSDCKLAESAPSVSEFLRVLQEKRCLVVLDNVETILNTGAGTLCDRAGQYVTGYEGYGELFQRIGEARHRSCVVLTSREKPAELAALEGEACPSRSLQLTGLSATESRHLFAAKGAFRGSETDWQHLVTHYAGNPLALKMAAAGIQELFDSDIAEFLRYLERRGLVFDDIRALLTCQFNRLSDLERDMMYWLAVKREPVSCRQLLDDAIVPDAALLVPKALRSLQRRSLCVAVKPQAGDSVHAEGITLQPVVMEFTTNHLIEQIEREIVEGRVEYLDRLPLLEARGKDYARSLQRREIVQPIVQRLLARRDRQAVTAQLAQIVETLRTSSPCQTGFAAGNAINVLTHLQNHLNDWDFSFLSIRHADLRHVSLNRTQFTGARFVQSAFTETFGIPLAIAYSPDGRALVTGGADNAIALWQADGSKVTEGIGHRGWVWSVAYHPDGGTIASGSDDGDVRMWDARTGECLAVLDRHERPVWAVAFSPDGMLLASAGEDGTICLWHGRSGKPLATLSAGTWVRSLAFHPIQPVLASSGDDGAIQLWNVETHAAERQLSGHATIAWAIAFSPDGRLLASGSSDSSVKVWEFDTGRCLQSLTGHHNQVRALAFQPLSHQEEEPAYYLASSGEDRAIRLWNASTGDCLHHLSGHGNWVRSVAFSPDGRTLASGGGDRAIKFWNVMRGQCDRAIQGYANRMWSVAAHPNGLTIASAHDDRAIRLWDSQSGRCLRTLRGHQSTVYSVAFDPKGRYIVSGSGDKTVKVWDTVSHRCWRTFVGHESRVWSVAVSPNGRWIASGSDDGTVRIWDLECDCGARVLRGHASWVCAVAFSPDGRYLASGSYDRSVKIWDLERYECLHTLAEHSHWIWSVTFSADSRYLATAGGDGTIQLWALADLALQRAAGPVQTLAAHDSRIWSLAFSADSHKLASCSSDLTVKVWDVETGACDRVLSGHENLVWSVAFSPDGQVLYSCSQDETLRAWDIASGQCRHRLEAARPYEDMAIAGVVGLSNVQMRTLQALGASDRAPETLTFLLPEPEFAMFNLRA